MALECFHCQTEVNGGIKGLFAHFRAFSLLRGSDFRSIAVCEQNGCQQSFWKSYSFKRHIIKQHTMPYICNGEHIQEQDDDLPVEAVIGNIQQDDICIDDMDEDSDDDAYNEEWDHLDEQQVKERALMLICKLKSFSRVSQNLVSTMVQDVSQPFDDLVGSLKENTKAFLHSQNVDTNSEPVLELFEKFSLCQKPFYDIETDYKQLQYLLASKNFIQPIEKQKTLGYAPRTDITNGNVMQVPTPRVFYYVPIKDVIKLIFESPGFVECVNEHRGSTDGVMGDFHDGEYCKTHYLFQRKNSLQLILSMMMWK